MIPRTVVPVRPSVTEEQFHSSMIAGLNRAEMALGTRKALAYVMDLDPKSVKNIFAGGSTDAKRLWDAQAVEPSVLDDIADLYGMKIVAKDAVCSTDRNLSVVTCALLKKAIDAEMDGEVDHTELLGMEAELREMKALISVRLEQIKALRAPRVVAA